MGHLKWDDGRAGQVRYGRKRSAERCDQLNAHQKKNRPADVLGHAERQINAGRNQNQCEYSDDQDCKKEFQIGSARENPAHYLHKSIAMRQNGSIRNHSGFTGHKPILLLRLAFKVN